MALDLQTLKRDPGGNSYVDVELAPYVEAAPPEADKAIAPKLIKYRSFDELEVPAFPREEQGSRGDRYPRWSIVTGSGTV